MTPEFSQNPSMTTAPRPRDVQVDAIAAQTTVLRSRTWERLKFEVEYSRGQGTTANSYVIQGDRTALIDPPGESFTQIYVQALQRYLVGSSLDYIVLSHVNPNRMATLAPLMAQMPQVTLLCSRPAAQALKATFPDWGDRIQTVSPPIETLDLGQGHQLQLRPIPTPRWPDGLCSYDPATRTLFSDKLFGTHLCSDTLFDEDWRRLEADRKYYFDCLHAAQTQQVQAALAQFAPLPIQCIAPGHGPVIRYSLSRLQQHYQQWCQESNSQSLRVAIVYATAYGNTSILAGAIAQGLIESGVAVESINCELSTSTELAQAIEASDGFIIGSPTLGGHAPLQIQTALGTVLASAAKTKLAGVFGSYGWSGEAIDLVAAKLQDGGYRFGFEPIRVRFTPDIAALNACRNASARFARQLKKQNRQAPQQKVAIQTNRTEQAVGRVIGSIGVITTCLGDSHSGILTHSISQASFDPPGVMITVAGEGYEQRFLQPKASFVLNLLKEGREVRRQFSNKPRPGDNPFATLAHREAANGGLILEDALAYLECRVERWMPCGDRWLIYAVVDAGDVLEPTGLTAIQYGKVTS